MWPEQLQKILTSYYEIQEKSQEKNLTAEQKDLLVESLISTYNTLTEHEKRDVLVPAKGQFLKDHAINADRVGSGKYRYEINYNWPPNDGFHGECHQTTLMPGEEYDRIGGARGIFLTPIMANGCSTSYLARALPYYIPELNICKNPAYHRYRVISPYKGYGSTIAQSVLKGIISKAFWCDPDDGGGEQVRLPQRIRELGEVLYEI